MDACDFLFNLLASCVSSGYGRWGAEMIGAFSSFRGTGFELRWNSFSIACGIRSSQHLGALDFHEDGFRLSDSLSIY